MAHTHDTLTCFTANRKSFRQQIVERGTHHELLEQKGVYQRLYASQFKGQLEEA